MIALAMVLLIQTVALNFCSWQLVALPLGWAYWRTTPAFLLPLLPRLLMEWTPALALLCGAAELLIAGHYFLLNAT